MSRTFAIFAYQTKNPNETQRLTNSISKRYSASSKPHSFQIF